MLDSQSLRHAFIGTTVTRPSQSMRSTPPELTDFHIEGEECTSDTEAHRPNFASEGDSLCEAPATEEYDEEEEEEQEGDDEVDEHADTESQSSTEEALYSDTNGDLPSGTLQIDCEPNRETDGDVMEKSSIKQVKPSTPTHDSGLKSIHNISARPTHITKGGKSNGPGTPKACAKKSFVWKYFHHPELSSGVIDRSRTQCVLCDSQLAFNASGTTTTMLNHLKSRHGDIAEQEELQRRHTKHKGSASNNRPTNNEHTSNSVGDATDCTRTESANTQRSLSHAISAATRSPSGHRGRPPGSSRRVRPPKMGEVTEYSPQSTALQACRMKPESNSLFPLACYAGLPDQRALLNGILLHADALNGGTDDTYHGKNQNNQRNDLDSLFANATGGTAASVQSRLLDQPDSNLIATMAANNMLPFPFFNRTFPMRSMCALPNTSTMVPGQLHCPVLHELSPASSSSLGVSVSSPVDTPTTSASPPNSTDNQLVTSPQWLNTQQQGQLRLRDPKHSMHPTLLSRQLTGRGELSTSVTSVLMNGHSSVLNSPTSSSNGKSSTDTSTGMVNEGPSNGSNHFRPDTATSLLRPQANNTLPHSPSSLTDPSSANFWNLMNFIPQLGNYATTNNLQHNHQNHTHHQQQQLQQQQQWLVANALFAGLANGRLLSDPDMLVGPTNLFNSFSNGTEHMSSGVVKMNGSGPVNGTKDLQPKQVSPNPIGLFTDSATQLQQQQQQQLLKAASDRFLAWSHIQQSNVPTTETTNASVLLNSCHSPPVDVASTTGVFCQKPYMQKSSAVSSMPYHLATTLNLFPPISTDSTRDFRTNLSKVCGVHHQNGSSLSFLQTCGSDSVDSLDLSTPKNGKDNVLRTIDDSYQPVMNANSGEHPDSGLPPIAAAKRKRARPIYISPQFDEKRRLLSDGDASSGMTAADLRSSNSMAENSSNPIESSPSGLEDIKITTVNQDTLIEHLAYFLVRDLQPPELIEGEGFKRLFGLLSQHELPTAKQMRDSVMVRLLDTVRIGLETKISSNYITSETELSDTNQKSFIGSFALSLELWSSESSLVDRISVDELKLECQALRPTYHANLAIHCSTTRSPSMLHYLQDCITFNDSETLRKALQRCCRNVARYSANDPERCVSTFPCPLVTNDPERLRAFLTDSPPLDTNHDGEQFLILPCLVSGLARTVTTSLMLPRVQELLNSMRKHISPNVPLSSSYRSSRDTTQTSQNDNRLTNEMNTTMGQAERKCGLHDEAYTHVPCTSWFSTYKLLKHLNELTSVSHPNPTELKCLKQLKEILEALNQTLELIHRKDLILTASMIEPIIQNLQQTYLVSNGSTNDQLEPIAIDEFKSSLSAQLKELFSDDIVREVLQLSSLLDPRFKEHVQEKLPDTVKLLKSKVESTSLPSEEIPRNTSNPNDSPPSGRIKSSLEKSADLQNVFGLQCFPRSSLSEVDRYLREDPIGLEEDPLAWWNEKSVVYPHVAALAFRYLTIPLTCFATGRLLSHWSTGCDDSATASCDSLHDGLGLPNIVDPLGRGRGRLRSEDQATYNLLWHNWKLPL